MSFRKSGFTLIELLIVVAIIAILAAIAVPNFLEAQVRSKVSRVKADQRSLATAIEAYYVDNNDYPAVDSSEDNGTSGFGVNNITNASTSLLKMPTMRRKQNADDGLHTLTTPISYITSMFPDPFAKTKGAVYLYSTPSTNLSPETQKGGWIVWSYGPDGDEVPIGAVGQGGDIKMDANYDAELTRVEETWYNPNQKIPSDVLVDQGTYDPTNGSTSSGDVYRVKQ